MNKIRLFTLAALAAVCMSVSAQSVGRKFSTLYVQYNPSQFHTSYENISENTSYNAISAGYSMTYPIADALMIEGGLKAQWLFRSESENGQDNKVNIVSATIPINLVYTFVVTENVFSIDPYVGLFARGNIIGKQKHEGNSHSHDYNLFSDDDMGNNAYKRFQFGFQAGVKFRINDIFTVGGGYWMDFNKIAEHSNFQGFDITLGLTI